MFLIFKKLKIKWYKEWNSHALINWNQGKYAIINKIIWLNFQVLILEEPELASQKFGSNSSLTKMMKLFHLVNCHARVLTCTIWYVHRRDPLIVKWRILF